MPDTGNEFSSATRSYPAREVSTHSWPQATCSTLGWALAMVSRTDMAWSLGNAHSLRPGALFCSVVPSTPNGCRHIKGIQNTFADWNLQEKCFVTHTCCGGKKLWLGRLKASHWHFLYQFSFPAPSSRLHQTSLTSHSTTVTLLPA